MSDPQKVLITSALPYANGPLHFGHIAGAYLPADSYARFMRLKGADVLYVCGSDEYGVAITLSAELAKRSCQEHVDLFHQVNRDFFKQLGIRFDHFSRTTCKEHRPVVQQFFNELNANGHIEKRSTEQLYSEKEGRFLADRYVVGTCPKCGFEEARGDECTKCGASYEAMDLKKPRSKLTGSALSLRATTHWFLRFDHFKEQLHAFLKQRSWRDNVTNFAAAYVDELKERAITRDLKWGVDVPLDEAKDKVFYVWFDAPIGYISATQEWAKEQGDPKKWESYWLDPKTKYVQFVGKDNIPFHAIFFPAMIMGQEIPYKQVDDLVANEFYHLEGRQFSKSSGWMIDLDHFFKRYHADQIRFMLAATAPESKDSEFTWSDFQMNVNQQLLGKFGNFVNRVLVFVQNKLEKKVPAKGELEEHDLRFLDAMKRTIEEIEESYSTYRLRRASQQIMELAHLGNTYFDTKAPWKAKKDPALYASMQTTLALCLECIKNLALVSFPIIPGSAEKIWQMVGYTEPLEKQDWNEVQASELPVGRELQKPFILFQKVEDEMITEEVENLEKMHEQATEKKEPPYAPLKEMISIDEVDQLDLRVGLILEAEKVAKSKKLLKLEVDIGFEKRTLLSGISQHYSAEELVGKKVIVVANLKPVKLMGIESQGMVLAGSLDTSLELITIRDLPAGAIIS